jgi:hypothetical protein
MPSDSQIENSIRRGKEVLARTNIEPSIREAINSFIELVEIFKLEEFNASKEAMNFRLKEAKHNETKFKLQELKKQQKIQIEKLKEAIPEIRLITQSIQRIEKEGSEHQTEVPILKDATRKIILAITAVLSRQDELEHDN